MPPVLEEIIKGLLIPEKEFTFLKLHNAPLKLYASPRLFMPNQTTAAIAESVKINGGEIGIEIGAGIGPLSVLLASQPLKHLYSTEVNEEQCEIARKNHKRYNLSDKITLYRGSIFDPIAENHPDLKADFIVSDISGMAEEPGRKLGWYPPAIPTGGPDGTEKIIPLIEQAPHFLKPEGRLYFPIVVNFSDGDKIKRIAQDNFKEIELVNSVSIPLTKELLNIVDNLSSGIYLPVQRAGSRGRWHLEIYEARASIQPC